MDEQNSGGFIERLRNSPRTVSTIIVILIIAGAIFAFSDRKPQDETSTAEPTEQATEQPSEEATASAEASATADSAKGKEAAKEQPKETAKATEQPSEEPKSSETADDYNEVAASGQGMTNLARVATKRYLETNPSEGLSNEHRVYIEDYVRKKLAKKSVSTGETVTISKNLVREAVEASKKLSDAQLQNLQKYSRQVRWQ